MKFILSDDFMQRNDLKVYSLLLSFLLSVREKNVAGQSFDWTSDPQHVLSVYIYIAICYVPSNYSPTILALYDIIDNAKQSEKLNQICVFGILYNLNNQVQVQVGVVALMSSSIAHLTAHSGPLWRHGWTLSLYWSNSARIGGWSAQGLHNLNNWPTKFLHAVFVRQETCSAT